MIFVDAPSSLLYVETSSCLLLNSCLAGRVQVGRSMKVGKLVVKLAWDSGIEEGVTIN